MELWTLQLLNGSRKSDCRNTNKEAATSNYEVIKWSVVHKGLPLHTEYRVFVDFDTNQVIGVNPYWDPDVMKQRFGHSPDSDSPHNIHDYVIYKAHEERLMGRYNENVDKAVKNLEKMLPDVNLGGQWSIDIMQNGDDFWIIDMGLAVDSALVNCVPKNKLKPKVENWIPQLPGYENKE